MHKIRQNGGIMKKVICSIFAILLVFCFVGCSSNTETALAKRISKNTSNLLEAINNLEEVTQTDIEISEFNNSYMGNTVSKAIEDYTPYKMSKISKIKSIFSRQNLTNIQNLEETNNTKAVNNSIYKPKYVSNTTTENNYLDIFKTKIENLYNVCSDCSYINSECSKCQSELKTSINECRVLCGKLETGEIKLTEEQLKECNAYCEQMNSCANDIKNCKGDCNNYLNTLRALKGYFGSNTETLANSYLNLIGCLENRLCCYNEALECVNNCNSLLKSCYKEQDNETSENNTIEEKDPEVQNTTQKAQYPYNNNVPLQYPYNNHIPYGGYNSNNGYYNNGFNNGYYPYANPYNQTPNNVNTYGPINRNIDTYQNVENNLIEANKENRTITQKENNVTNNDENKNLTQGQQNKENQEINKQTTQENKGQSTKFQEISAKNNGSDNLKEEKFVRVERQKKPLIFPRKEIKPDEIKSNERLSESQNEVVEEQKRTEKDEDEDKTSTQNSENSKILGQNLNKKTTDDKILSKENKAQI